MAGSPVPKGRDWRVDVLRALGAPVTSGNVWFLTSWQISEGGDTNNSAHYNYLNTTSGPGPSINSVGVKSFPDYATGIQQTAATIANGRYNVVLNALRKGDPYDAKVREGILGDLSTWVSGSRTANLGYGGAILNRQPSFGQAKTIPGVHAPPLAGIPGGGAIESGAKTAAGVVTAPARGLEWVFGNWDRVLEVAGGILLVLVGLVLMGRSLGVTKTKIEVVQRNLPGGDERATQAAAAAAEERAYTRAAAAAGRERARSSVAATDAEERKDARRARARARTSSSQSDDIPF